MSAGVTIRPLSRDRDAAAVTDLYLRAADYVLLEGGTPPTPAMTQDFFDDAPPGGDPSEGSKLGLFDEDRLVGIADLAFGWPEPRDAYLGTMILAPEARGCGLGTTFLRALEAAARARHAPRLLLAVLEDNPRGRAFWEREGFRVVRTFPPARVGMRDHIRHRMAKRL